MSELKITLREGALETVTVGVMEDIENQMHTGQPIKASREFADQFALLELDGQPVAARALTMKQLNEAIRAIMGYYQKQAAGGPQAGN